MCKLEDIDPEYKKLKAEEKKFDRYFAKIQNAEAKYKEDSNIKKLISFWEKLWATEKVHNLSYKWAFRLVNIYMEIEDYDKALNALHYIDDTPYFENNNGLYKSYEARIVKLKAKKEKSASKK